jgi:ABC-type phosphate transport system permease subunit
MRRPPPTPIASPRSGRVREQVLKAALGASSMVMVSAYAIGLLYLLTRGGGKLISFTSFAYPLSDIEGEGTMRFVVAACVFGALAWAVSSTARFALQRTVGWSKRSNRGARIFVGASALIGALVARNHLPRFLVTLPSETTAGGGVGPEIFNTIYFAVLSTAVTLPIGVGAAIYLARFARSRRFVGALRTALDTLASLPSIVYGLFGFLVFVVEMKAGYSLLAGAFVLALLNLPLMVGVTEESLRAVPHELEDASLALGAT